VLSKRIFFPWKHRRESPDQLLKTPWQRFARLQRTAARLAEGRGQPRSVYKFSSNKACTTWTANLNREKLTCVPTDADQVVLARNLTAKASPT
jgi:hypothetical protein